MNAKAICGDSGFEQRLDQALGYIRIIGVGIGLSCLIIAIPSFLWTVGLIRSETLGSFLEAGFLWIVALSCVVVALITIVLVLIHKEKLHVKNISTLQALLGVGIDDERTAPEEITEGVQGLLKQDLQKGRQALQLLEKIGFVDHYEAVRLELEVELPVRNELNSSPT